MVKRNQWTKMIQYQTVVYLQLIILHSSVRQYQKNENCAEERDVKGIVEESIKKDTPKVRNSNKYNDSK